MADVEKRKYVEVSITVTDEETGLVTFKATVAEGQMSMDDTKTREGQLLQQLTTLYGGILSGKVK